MNIIDWLGMVTGAVEVKHSCTDGMNGGGNGECLACGERDCPHGEALHYHHDGCPSCEFQDVPIEGEQTKG